MLNTSTTQAPRLALKSETNRNRQGEIISRSLTYKSFFRDIWCPALPPSLSRRITVNLAIFWKFRWGRCGGRGTLLFLPPGTSDWVFPGGRSGTTQVPCVQEPDQLGSSITGGEGHILLCRTWALPAVRMKAQGETEERVTEGRSGRDTAGGANASAGATLPRAQDLGGGICLSFRFWLPSLVMETSTLGRWGLPTWVWVSYLARGNIWASGHFLT